MSGDELSRLHDRIDEQNKILMDLRDGIRSAVSCVEHQQAICSERVKHFAGELNDLKKAVWGNGREGLDDRTKGLEVAVKALTDERKTMQVGSGEISVKAVVTILAAVSAMVGGVLSQLPAMLEVFK